MASGSEIGGPLSQRSGAAAVVAVIVLGALVPLFAGSAYVVSVAMQVEILMCLALGLNFVVGYAGMLDLGFAAFFAIGAYTTGLLSVHLHWPILATLPVALLAALAGAVFIGAPTLRLRSDYLAVVTLGFGEIIQNLVNNLSQTGGPEGIYGIPPLSIGGFSVASTAGYYYVFLVLVVLFAAISVRVRGSRLGRAWLAIREDEDTAQAMGIKVRRYKLYAYMAGSVFGSLTGSFYAPAFIAIAPPSFGFSESLLVVMAVSIGGMGSVWGALLGAGVVIAFPEVFRQFAQARLLVFGLVLVAIMVLRPQGVWPEGGLAFGRRARELWAAVRGLWAPTGGEQALEASFGGSGGTPGDDVESRLSHRAGAPEEVQ